MGRGGWVGSGGGGATSINSSIWIAQIAQSISHINGENNEEWFFCEGAGILCPGSESLGQHAKGPSLGPIS